MKMIRQVFIIVYSSILLHYPQFVVEWLHQKQQAQALKLCRQRFTDSVQNLGQSLKYIVFQKISDWRISCELGGAPKKQYSEFLKLIFIFCGINYRQWTTVATRMGDMPI